MSESEELANRLADETARLAGRLAFAIEPYDSDDRYALAAAPIAVVFERDADATVMPRHRSGRIAPELLPFLVDATQRTRARLAYGDGRDNPYLIALVLAAFYVIEGARSGALGLDRVAGQMPKVAVLEEEAATRDLQVRPGTTALRIVAPVEGETGRELQAAVELSWSA